MERDLLPTTFKPSNYNLSIDGITFSPTWTYEGLVVISGSVESAKEVVVNAQELKIHETHLKIGTTVRTAKVRYQQEQQRARLLFDKSFPASQHAELIIRFRGLITNEKAGFSRSRYKPPKPSAFSCAENGHHCMLFTQFQPCDARRAFPCFDEPALKASFELSIEVPNDCIALCNTPERETTGSKRPPDSKDWKWQVVKFERSPPMSTYLYTWAFGDFGHIEALSERKYDGKRLPVRVYATKGLEEQGRYALEHAWKIIDLLSEVFRIDYPLPKLDLLAVHDFPTGAMEGWGLATFQTNMLLFDEENSNERFRPRIVNVVGHELAHQWFGNLVTMGWWNELWLNEGFATWVGWYVTNRLHPGEWSVWAQFVSMSDAFNLDSVRNSHPVEVPVRSAQDIAQIFDAISYLKGSSLIRMLTAHLSENVFMQGVARYLKNHAYGHAKTDDLWWALSEAAGQDVSKMMEQWIKRIGTPYVTVTEEPSGDISLRQSRFLLSGDTKSEDDQTLWTIPLALETNTRARETCLLTTKEDTLRNLNVDDAFYKINKDHIGFYRTNYSPERLSKLASPDSRARLSSEDKIGLISDAAALAAAGHSTTAALLTFVESCADEDSYLVWKSIISTLNHVRYIFLESRVGNALTALMVSLITPAVEKIGWEPNGEEGLLHGQLRALLIESAGLAGHQSTIEEALSRFERYTAEGDESAIHSSLRSPVFRIAVKYRGKSAYDAAQKVYLTSKTFDGAAMALTAMGHASTPVLAHEYLRFTFGGNVKFQDMHHVARSLADNPAVNIEVWNYIKQHYHEMRKTLPLNVLDSFLRMSLARYSSMEIHADINRFFADKDCKGFDRGLAVVLDQIANASAYRVRDSEALQEWLEVHGYL